jgi:hypothetical protein
MLLDEKIEPLVARSFGLKNARWGVHSSIVGEDRETTGYAIVDYLWWARVMEMGSCKVITGVASFSHYPEKGSNFSLGLLLVSRNLLKLQFLGKQPFRSIELPTNADQVASVLRCMNLLEPEVGIIPGNDIMGPWINLFISSPNGDREITCRGGPMQDSSWINLREALFAYAARLNELYNDPEIREALEPKNIRRALE